MIERRPNGSLVYTPDIVMVGICRDCGAEVPDQQFAEIQKCSRCAALRAQVQEREKSQQ